MTLQLVKIGIPHSPRYALVPQQVTCIYKMVIAPVWVPATLSRVRGKPAQDQPQLQLQHLRRILYRKIRSLRSWERQMESCWEITCMQRSCTKSKGKRSLDYRSRYKRWTRSTSKSHCSIGMTWRRRMPKSRCCSSRSTLWSRVSSIWRIRYKLNLLRRWRTQRVLSREDLTSYRRYSSALMSLTNPAVKGECMSAPTVSQAS